MVMNPSKTRVVHLGNRNPIRNYVIDGQVLSRVSCIRDLGVLVDNGLNFSQHVSQVCKKANSRLYLIHKCFTCKDPIFQISMYKMYVRPILEYASTVWSPRLLKDVEDIERIQQRFLRRVFPELIGYEQRLAAANIPSLAARRRSRDLCMVHKIVNSVNCNKFFSIAENCKTRGHKLKIVKQYSRLEIHRLFFSQRVVNLWNKLPATIVEAQTSEEFSSMLSEYLGVDRQQR